MPITELYGEYFQKSKTFLFPMLNIRKASATTGLMTFISWEGKYSPKDQKLIVIKKGGLDLESFRAFEKQSLIGNPMFETVYELDGMNSMAYVFSFADFKNDWNHFLAGRYSKMSEEAKTRIKNYFNDKSVEWEYIRSFIFPEKFFDLYAQLLNVEPSLLRSVGELCDLYDPKAESFKLVRETVKEI